MLEKDQLNQDLIEPQFGDPRLVGLERLNESKLFLLLKDHSQDERGALLTLSLQELADEQEKAKNSKESCDINDVKFSSFAAKEAFWMMFKDYVQKRQSYFHKLDSVS
jgi:hypothetical protein